MARPTLPVVAALLAARTVTTASAQDIDSVVAADLTPTRPGIVVALEHQDLAPYVESFGTHALDTTTALETTDVFAYPAFTELLLAATVYALDGAGVVDAEAPISRYLDGLSPLVGRITLTQLLTGTAGLDDAARVAGESWERTLDRIDDRALVVEPGTLYSWSKHSLPLAARLLERTLGRPFTEIATSAILEPLGMRRSTFDIDSARAWGLLRGVRSGTEITTPVVAVEAADTLDGLPVLFTTAGDLLAFLSAWMDGDLRGRSPADIPTAVEPVPTVARRYGGGLWADEYRGLARAYRSAGAFGTSAILHLLPETRSIVLVLAIGAAPSRTAGFVLDRLADAVGAPPRRSTTAGRATDGTWSLPDPGRWAGTYRNGDQIFLLREVDGALVVVTATQQLPLSATGPSSYAAHIPDGRVGFAFDLFEDAGGRRHLYHRALVYRHEEDPLVTPR